MLPIFPLNVILFPGEKLNLHIFEQRYRQLINDCLATGQTFGIPVYLDGKVQQFGTEARILELVNRLPDGRMDIRTEGLQVFRMNSFENPLPGKLYAGADAEFIELYEDAEIPLKVLCREGVLHYYELLKINRLTESEAPFYSFRLADNIGMSEGQKYALLTTESENERLKMVLAHLRHILPVIEESEKTKARIRMNGHFQNLPPLDF